MYAYAKPLDFLLTVIIHNLPYLQVGILSECLDFTELSTIRAFVPCRGFWIVTFALTSAVCTPNLIAMLAAFHIGA